LWFSSQLILSPNAGNPCEINQWEQEHETQVHVFGAAQFQVEFILWALDGALACKSRVIYNRLVVNEKCLADVVRCLNSFRMMYRKRYLLPFVGCYYFGFYLSSADAPPLLPKSHNLLSKRSKKRT
jgi:hypothetical protein